MSHHDKGERGRGQDKPGGGMPGDAADDGGRGPGRGRGRSESSPGHLKKAAGEQSARDFAAGQGGDAPGRMDRDRGENATEQEEPDSLVREG
jgi:hypothetical protein